MLQYQDINVGVGKIQPVGIPGRFLYYLAGSAGGLDPTVTVRSGNTANVALLKPGQSFRLAAEDKTVDTFFIGNFAGQGSITGQLLVGDGDFTDNRVSGSVEVVDGGKARTLAGMAFMGMAGVGGVAANNPHAQLWNPVGSGKNIVVEQLTIATSLASIVDVGINSVVLTNVNGAPQNKRFGSAAPTVAQTRNQNAGVMLLDATLASTLLAANAGLVLPFHEPVVLQPGKGLVVGSETQNTLLLVTFEYFEEPL